MLTTFEFFAFVDCDTHQNHGMIFMLNKEKTNDCRLFEKTFVKRVIERIHFCVEEFSKYSMFL